MNTTVISILVAVALIGGAIMFSGGNKTQTSGTEQDGSNVNIVDGKQIITINAKGNYSPKTTTAKAGIPTVIKMNTHGTFDCTAALTIPSLNYRNNLPPSGETLIDISPQKAGAIIRGMCAMGMYNFSVTFN